MVKQWWDELRQAGSPLGYYPNPKKCWLVVKPEKEGRAKEMSGLVFASPPRGANTWALRWAHSPILSIREFKIPGRLTSRTADRK